MTKFKDLKSQWENQSELKTPNNGSEQIIQRMNFVKRKQLITNIVLGVTSIVLVSFFFYIKAYKNEIVAFALLLMIGSLLIRIFIENRSSQKLKNINITVDARTFKQKMIEYYKKRIKIHYVITPVIVALYIIGFIMLLPFFKQELSTGFYIYIKLSAIMILIVLTIFIRKQVLKERNTLKELCN